MAEGGQAMGEFDRWLNNTLETFGADENVFGSYIRGILEGEDGEDEKKATLESVLSDMTENDITKLSQEILEKWNLLKIESKVNGVHEDVDVKLARLMESQVIATKSRNNNYTDEEKRIRDAILSQYGQYSDEECDDAPESGAKVPAASTSSGGLERNTNAALVAQAEREKREQSKQDSQKKKEKDKEDREKQKQMQADKKEKRKTQKGERRR